MPLEKLPVILTPEERSMRAHEAARYLGEYRQKEERKKLVVKELSEELKELREKADEAARAATSGVEEREVPVTAKPDNHRLVMEYFRDDTGDLVRTRPMTDDEARVARQQVLPLRPPTATSPLRGITRPPINTDPNPTDGKPS